VNHPSVGPVRWVSAQLSRAWLKPRYNQPLRLKPR
jgi:hypothetical protein